MDGLALANVVQRTAKIVALPGQFSTTPGEPACCGGLTYRRDRVAFRLAAMKRRLSAVGQLITDDAKALAAIV